ncbi:hypothetical protein CU084_15145 [Bacillus velezensis]|nr:hypothetical protein CU084_15145 [Bacillus velezensis]
MAFLGLHLFLSCIFVFSLFRRGCGCCIYKHVTGYVASKGDIRLKSAEKWIVLYTKAKYEVTTKIYIRKFEPTKTKTWISEADPNIDSVE